MARQEHVLRDIKSQQAKSRPGKHSRLPITPDLLMKIREAWEQDAHNFNKIMLWAAVCPVFWGFLRAGEMTVPSLNGYDEGYHLTFDAIVVGNHSNPSLLWVRIKGSKTDPFREGVNIFLRRAHNKLCQVETMLAYLAVRGSASGFLFKFADGHLLTKEHFTKEAREALLAKGVKASCMRATVSA